MDLTHTNWELSIVDEDLRLISWGFRSKKWMFSTPFGACMGQALEALWPHGLCAVLAMCRGGPANHDSY
jgi:hypothetical protein